MKHSHAPIEGVSRETADRLAVYVDLLLRWQRTINLISPKDVEHVWTRHLADSLQLAPLIPKDTIRGIDLGSGAGLPGLVLAIATGVSFDLVESDQRKAAFLREAARLTAAPAVVHSVRIEAAVLRPARLITARALAPLPVLLRWAYPLLAPNGACVFPKGQNVEDELTGAANQWHMQVRRTASRTNPSATILCISEIGPVQPDR